MSRRFAANPARPRSVLKYHWYQWRYSCSAEAGSRAAAMFWML